MIDCISILPTCEGICCGVCPIPSLTFEKHKAQVQRRIIRVIPLGVFVVPITEDNACVFLKADKRCGIYEDRPIICKMYGEIDELPCAFINKDGVVRTKEDREKTIQLINKQDAERLASLRSELGDSRNI